jgi:hypothetical protein
MGVQWDSISLYLKAFAYARELLYSILIEFGVPMKLVSWLKCV